MRSIKIRIVVLIGLLLIVICSGLGIEAYNSSANSLIENSKEMMPKFAVEASKSINEGVSKQFGSLEQLSSIMDTNVLKNPAADISSIKSVLAKETKRAGNLRMAIINKQGRAIYDNGDNVDLKDADYFKRSINGENVVTDPIKSGDNSIIMIYTVPIKVDNEILGVLMAERDGYELSDLAKNITYGKTGEAFLINKQARTIAHADKTLITKILKSSTSNVDATASATEPANDATKKDVTDSFGFGNFAELGKQMADGKIGFGEYKFNGISKYMGFAPVSNAGWSVSIEINKDEVLSGLTGLKIKFLRTTLIFLIISFIVGYLIARSISNPIAFITKASDEMANGNFIFIKENRYANRKDEIGKLAVSFNRIKINVSEIIEEVKKLSMEVAKLSDRMSHSAEANGKASQQISAATNVMAEGASMQNNKVISIIEEIEASVQKTKEGYKMADEMLKTAKFSSDIAVSGRNKIKEVIEQFEWISKTVEFATESIQNLGKRSGEIGEFISVIKGIASQTNMLSLNASIEAARAGENGKGFSVVANEIRNLSVSCANAAKTIGDLISDSQAETSITVKTMETNLEKVNTQLSSIKGGGQALETIVDKVKETEDSATDIYDIYKQIQKMSEDINNSVDDISSVISNNAAYSQEVAASSEEQYSSMEGLVANAAELASLAEDLQKEISKFKSTIL